MVGNCHNHKIYGTIESKVPELFVSDFVIQVLNVHTNFRDAPWIKRFQKIGVCNLWKRHRMGSVCGDKLCLWEQNESAHVHVCVCVLCVSTAPAGRERECVGGERWRDWKTESCALSSHFRVFTSTFLEFFFLSDMCANILLSFSAHAQPTSTHKCRFPAIFSRQNVQETQTARPVIEGENLKAREPLSLLVLLPVATTKSPSFCGVYFLFVGDYENRLNCKGR